MTCTCRTLRATTTSTGMTRWPRRCEVGVCGMRVWCGIVLWNTNALFALVLCCTPTNAHVCGSPQPQLKRSNTSDDKRVTIQEDPNTTSTPPTPQGAAHAHHTAESPGDSDTSSTHAHSHTHTRARQDSMSDDDFDHDSGASAPTTPTHSQDVSLASQTSDDSFDSLDVTTPKGNRRHQVR